MPDWRELYSSAVIESNPEYLELLLREAEEAMFARLEELNKSSNGGTERLEIKAALEVVLTVRVEKLGWPTVPMF